MGICCPRASRWIRRTLDSRTAKFTNKQQIQEWVDDYGEDSDFVRVRVRGECPRAATNQLIPNDRVAAARKFKATGYERLPKILALDVARFGDDRTVWEYAKDGASVSTPSFAALTRSKRRTESLHASRQKSPMPSWLMVTGWALVFVISFGTLAMARVFTSFTADLRAADVNKYFNRRAEVWGLDGRMAQDCADR